MAWQDAGASAEFPEGLHGVRIGTTRLVIASIGGELHAVDATCPHKFAAIEEGSIENGCIACPMHDAHFQPDGTPRAGDEWAGTLPTYPLKIDGERVLVDL